MDDPEFESRVLGFERAWRLHGSPEIGDFLGDPFAAPSPRRNRLLVELICIDLEYRWRDAGLHGPATLAAYAELIAPDRLPVELIGEEYRARRLWGDRPSHAEFLSPFGARRESIREELLRIDGEIAEEAAPGGSAPLPCRTPTAPHPGVPPLSDREFLLRRLIGAGRMGKVYRARWRGVGEDVAVKFLRKPLLRLADAVRRFLDEARTVAGLRHPNVVGTRGLGRTAGGSYFLVMDLVDGPDLARLAGERTVGEEEAIGWAMGICDAIAHAHERGVVHCDLKPANILLDPSGRVRVTDFGLARSLAGGTPSAAEIEGTAPFMAPEQASRAWGPIDRRTDVFGIGAVLFTLLTGRAPHVGRRLPDLLADVVSATPVISPDRLRPGLSGSLVDLCRKSLAKRPEERYPTVRELRSDLDRMRDGRRVGHPDVLDAGDPG